jgi:hypothetical protein
VNKPPDCSSGFGFVVVILCLNRTVGLINPQDPAP